MRPLEGQLELRCSNYCQLAGWTLEAIIEATDRQPRVKMAGYDLAIDALAARPEDRAPISPILDLAECYMAALRKRNLGGVGPNRARYR